MPDVTLKKISELTGISIRCVNRAFHGMPGISQSKREAVLRLGEKLGYAPNVSARNLRLGKNNFAGIVTPFTDSLPAGSINTRKTLELQLRLERAGFYTLLGTKTKDVKAMEKLLREWAGLASSVIFFSCGADPVPDSLLAKLPMRRIYIDYPSDSGHTLEIDRSSGIYDAIGHLLKSGRSKIVRCGDIDTREKGFNTALRDMRESVRMHRHIRARSEFEDGYALAPKIIKTGCDAVFFDTDRMAFGFLKYSQINGIRIPDDIAVVGFDDDPWDEYACPSLSTVAQPVEELVEAAASLVMNPKKEFVKMNFKTRFVKRESV